MAETMTPSKGITDGQIGKIKELLDPALRKSGLQNEPVQQVLKTPEQSGPMIAELVAVVRKYVEAVSSMIVRIVEKVDRKRKPQEMLDATGRTQYTDRKVVDSMPRGEGENAEVVFFKVGRYISDDDLKKEYELLGLKPADPYSLAAVNQADPAFADEKPNGTHWKDAKGNWCYATFDRWGGGREVGVHRIDYGWDGGWWFAGVRK